ncbi:Acyl-phosphate:glycerol-3-phosphate O-acyltransferase PlsY [Enhygromyxa salina]|uniref:Glycerol-3-phosphate acyltransferase n=1 Tax=Enhygromyxa salina TaxID=215803 RepID=A0A0C2CXZ5_9BACT|nr:glycerol-3-phosphate 1-O-acyltransferase PlsY [Enhygromyxa salina]KIG14525.1 Acyl-phosphate:glycerol-3-phosphate O-acyltransferase PlsY [Enhygromyxa salina]
MSLELLLWMLAAYLIAGIPVGLVVGRARGVDLREVGSGNIGATNALRAMGKAWGALVFVLDVAKAAVPVAAALHYLGPNPGGPTKVALVALAAILGHVFPIYLRFRGGKGVACAFGVFLVLAPKAALLSVIVYAQTVWLTRVSAVGSLTAALVIVVVAWVDPSVPLPYVILAAALAGLIWERHRPNLEQMFAHAREARAREAKLDRNE